MAFRYSSHSREQRGTLHPHLKEILDRTLQTDDHKIDQGERARDDQQAAFERGSSKVRGWNVDGTPNDYPHMVQWDGWCYAADVWPYINNKRLAPPDYDDIVRDERSTKLVVEAIGRYCQFAWFIRGVQEVARAYFEEVYEQTGERWELRPGLNWDMDAEILTDQNFDDFPHIEIRKVS